jgi:putative serine protease PepD
MNENPEHDSTNDQRDETGVPVPSQSDAAADAPTSPASVDANSTPSAAGDITPTAPAAPTAAAPSAAPYTAAPAALGGHATQAGQPAPTAQPGHAGQPAPAAQPTPQAHASAGSIYDIPAPAPSHSGAAFGAAARDGGSGRESGRRRIVVPVIAALAVGALLGGASGAGIALLVDNGDNRVVSESGSGTNITVNRSEDATPVTAVAAKASPSVVTISVSGTSSAGTGSGIVLSEDGYILTNTHVVTLDGSVADAQVSVTTSDGRIFTAKVVGTDPVVDLAVIKLDDASGLTPMDFADSDSLNVGDSAVAIGAPLGLSGTVTDGIISSLNRSITVASSAVPDSSQGQDETTPGQGGGSPYDFWNFDVPGENQEQQQSQQTGTISIPVIQTDAAINPGNSGGALLNSDGELIGVNVAIASAGNSSSSGSGNIGVGFAIPANLAKRVAEEIIDSGSATHGLLGASVGDATSVDPKTTVAGAYIQEVSDGGAAEAAGLRKGDIITQFNGVTVTSSTDLTAQVRYLAAGADAELVYFRGGESYEASVTLGELKL